MWCSCGAGDAPAAFAAPPPHFAGARSVAAARALRLRPSADSPRARGLTCSPSVLAACPDAPSPAARRSLTRLRAGAAVRAAGGGVQGSPAAFDGMVRLRCNALLRRLGADAAALRRRRQHGASAPYGGPSQQQFAPARPVFTPASAQRPPFAPPTRASASQDAPRTTAELPACFRGLFDFRCVPTVLSECPANACPVSAKPADRLRGAARRRTHPPRP